MPKTPQSGPPSTVSDGCDAPPVDRQARRLDVGLPDVFTGVFWHVSLPQSTPAVEGPYSTPMVTSDRNAALSAPSRGQRPGSLLRLRFSASSALPWPSSLRRPSPSPGQRRIRFSTRRGPPPPPPPPLLLLPARPVLPASRAAAPAWAERRQIPPWAAEQQLCVQRLPAGATEERLAGRYCGGSWCAAVPAEAIGSVLVARESKLPGPEKNLLIDRPRPCACGRKDGTDDAGPRQSPARRRRRAWSTSTRSSSTITRASSRATARGAGS